MCLRGVQRLLDFRRVTSLVMGHLAVTDAQDVMSVPEKNPFALLYSLSKHDDDSFQPLYSATYPS